MSLSNQSLIRRLLDLLDSAHDEEEKEALKNAIEELCAYDPPCVSPCPVPYPVPYPVYPKPYPYPTPWRPWQPTWIETNRYTTAGETQTWTQSGPMTTTLPGDSIL